MRARRSRATRAGEIRGEEFVSGAPDRFWLKILAGVAVATVVSAALVAIAGGAGQEPRDGVDYIGAALLVGLGGWPIFKGLRSRSLPSVFGGLCFVTGAVLLLLGLPTCQTGCEGAGG